MNRLSCIFFFVLLIPGYPVPCSASFEPLVAGARSAGMGETGSLIQPDAFDPCANPASLASLPCLVAGTFYASLFSMKELGHGGAAAGIRIPSGGLGIGCTSFGNDLYRETLIFLGMGRVIGPSLHAGLSLTAGNLEISRTRSRHVVSLNAGFFCDLKSCFSMGVSVRNWFQAGIGQSCEPVPRSMSLQFECLPVTGIRFNLELVKDVRFTPELRGGLEVIPLTGLSLACGFIHEPQSLTAGAGFTLDHLGIH
jgi:hypothetical protein